MIRVGLTGNIGCGKSTVARMLADLGAEIIDADRLVHELLSSGGRAVGPVLAAFPEAASPDGRSVDRAKLGSIVFGDEPRRRFLERLVHPLVWQRQRELTEAARQRGAGMVVTEATLLFEVARDGGPDPRERFDSLVTVACDPRLAIARAVDRSAPDASGEDRVAAEKRVTARLAAQMPQEEKMRLADHVIDTSGSLADTRRQVAVLHSALLEQAARTGS